MFWIKFQTIVSKSFAWMKNNWKIPLLVAWTMVVWIIARRDSESIKKVLEARKESHKKEIETINKIHVEKMLKIKEINERYQQTISELERRFKEQDRELSKKHIEDVKSVVVKSKGNPDEIKRKIEEEFGIKFKN